VVEAKAKRLTPLQVLESAKRVEEAPEPPPEIQIPFTAKQPPKILKPPREVVVPVPLIARLPANVEVAVEVAFR
jgi:hypothetical protein